MRYRPLGGTGMQVSAYCLGTMMFGEIGNPDHDDCARILHAALDRGINFVDTADMYGDGESEIVVGKALKGRRDDVVLATKGHFPVGSDEAGERGEGVNRSGNSRRWLTRALDDSLRRLQTDWVDLYQVHRPDPDTDIEETLSVLTDFVHAGKIRAFGCSTFPAEQIVDAYHVAQARGLMRFRTEQPPYSLLERGIERAILPVCQRFGMGVLTWSPLAYGFLSGRRDLRRPGVQPQAWDMSVPTNQVKQQAAERLAELAAELGHTLPELAMAFPGTHPGVTATIIGPRTMEQLESTLAGAGVVLDDDVLDRIDAIVAPGTSLHSAGAWRSRALEDPGLRRRPLAARQASE